MPTYISLLQYTDQGIRGIKDGSQRLDAARQGFEQAGAKLVAAYLVMGEYDLVVISEAPDDETVARIALSQASRGNVRTKTMRAFTETEMRGIISSLQ